VSANIHPSAIIDPRVELGESVEVGPYCVIGAGVELGDGCRLHHHVSLAGPAKIGPGNEFYPFACIGGRTQDLKYVGEPTYLEIGEGNVFREFATVNRSDNEGSVTRIGSHGNFLAYTHVAHDCQVGDHVIFSNNGTLAGHVVVGDHVVLGGLSAVHQFCRIGAHSITGGCSKIVQDVTPYTIVDGNPAEARGINHVGLGRRGFAAEAIAALREAFKVLFRRGLNTSQALARLREDHGGVAEVMELVAFVEASERGVTR
jgi:UDP-N-acetylglucosamine acyltransferase